MQVVEKFDPAEGAPHVPTVGVDGLARLQAPRPNPAAGPFPNLRCREVVKTLAARVGDMTAFCKFSDQEASMYALAFLQGVRAVADDLVLQGFVLGLIDKVNQGGVKELVEVVNGRPLETTLVPDLPDEVVVGRARLPMPLTESKDGVVE